MFKKRCASCSEWVRGLERGGLCNACIARQPQEDFLTLWQPPGLFDVPPCSPTEIEEDSPQATIPASPPEPTSIRVSVLETHSEPVAQEFVPAPKPQPAPEPEASQKRATSHDLEEPIFPVPKRSREDITQTAKNAQIARLRERQKEVSAYFLAREPCALTWQV